MKIFKMKKPTDTEHRFWTFFYFDLINASFI